MNALIRAVMAAALVVGIASPAQAQMMSAPPDTAGAATAPATQAPASGGEKWSFLIAPYFLAPSMVGTTGVGPLLVDVEASPSDVFDKLQFGFMVYTEARKGPWAFAFDALYMDLGQEGSTPLGTYDVSMKQGGYMFEIYRRVGPKFEVMAGATVNNLSAGVKTTGPLAVDNEDSKTWVDPMVGGRAELLKTPKWGLSLTGSVGGFGVGSEFAWQVYPLLCYRVSRVVDIGVAYRAFGIDYKEGSGNTEFVYDMVTFGPELGIGFHF